MKEHSDLWMWVSGGLAATIAWLFKLIITTRNELSGHKLHVAHKYVCKDDIRQMVKEVKEHTDERADRIEDKVDRLIADRSEGR
ncbi:hypothetical protein [Denitrobaculum tricleocarpae]|uniref:Uncharacterized protein n=1 Tax=Denitrobaculum tricleocarpae TaxID=2591009 RepID=A0A545TT40_9PROT|nr:hypothetical protein [Denitrobaculum tricleocarpae]TQV80311.1 hypothetical protein FKG95_08945 [Denitrobaculum tricleocarpae]